jgi:branched-subunit amino acid transport protein AzlD
MVNIVSVAMTAWTPLLVFPTIEAPRYLTGFCYVFACAVVAVAGCHVLAAVNYREE